MESSAASRSSAALTGAVRSASSTCQGSGDSGSSGASPASVSDRGPYRVVTATALDRGPSPMALTALTVYV